MSKKALLGGLLPFISNPVVLAVVGIGAIGMMLFSKEDDQDNGSEAVPDGSEPFLGPLESEDLTVPATVIEPFETVEATVGETDNLSVKEPYRAKDIGDCSSVSKHDETISDENFKKEMIRQAMSELGKRSAAARAKKKILA